MKYFAINYSNDVSVIGKTFPQSQETVHYFTRDILHSFYWNPNFNYPDNYIFPIPILDKRAIRTDLISHSGFSSFLLLVSERLKDLLVENSIQDDMYFFETKLKTKNGDIKYWAINPLISRDEFIDFENTTIILNNFKSNESNIVSIKTIDEYNEFIKQEYGVNIIRIEKICFNSNTNSDLFCIRHLNLNSGFIVSEKLKQILVDSKITGISFVEL